MNTLAHAVWGFSLAPKQNKNSIKYAIFYSILPDLMSLPLIGVYLLFTHKGIPHSWIDAPVWYFQIYSLAHSLVIWMMVFIFSSLMLRKIQWLQAFWLLHILVDIVGHRHFTTAFLYPISNYQFTSNFSWEENPFLIISLLAPMIIIAIRYFIKKKKEKMTGIDKNKIV